MTAKEFAEKYVGRTIRYKHIIGIGGIISGYGPMDDATTKVVYEEATGVRADNYRLTLLRPIQHFYWFDIRNVDDWALESLDVPEDCLNCGAIGDAPCKDGCPNK